MKNQTAFTLIELRITFIALAPVQAPDPIAHSLFPSL